MPTISELKKIQEEWREHCRQIQSLTDTKSLVLENATQKEQRIRRLQKDYAAFCEYYFPHFLTLRDKVTGEEKKPRKRSIRKSATSKKVTDADDME